MNLLMKMMQSSQLYTKPNKLLSISKLLIGVFCLCLFAFISPLSNNKILAQGENYIDNDDQWVSLYIGPSITQFYYMDTTYWSMFYPIENFVNSNNDGSISVNLPTISNSVSWFLVDGNYTNRSSYVMDLYNNAILSRRTIPNAYAMGMNGNTYQLYDYGYHIHNYDNVLTNIESYLNSIRVDTDALDRIEDALSPSNTKNLYETVDDIYTQLNGLKSIVESGIDNLLDKDNSVNVSLDDIAFTNSANSFVYQGYSEHLTNPKPTLDDDNYVTLAKCGYLYYSISGNIIQNHDTVYNITLPIVADSSNIGVDIKIYCLDDWSNDIYEINGIYNVTVNDDYNVNFTFIPTGDNYFTTNFVFEYKFSNGLGNYLSSNMSKFKYTTVENTNYYNIRDYYVSQSILDKLNNLEINIDTDSINIDTTDIESGIDNTILKLDDILDQLQLMYGYLQNQNEDISSLDKADLVDRDYLIDDLYDGQAVVVEFQNENNLTNNDKNIISQIASTNNGIFDAFFDNGFGVCLALPVVLAFVGLIL